MLQWCRSLISREIQATQEFLHLHCHLDRVLMQLVHLGVLLSICRSRLPGLDQGPAPGMKQVCRGMVLRLFESLLTGLQLFDCADTRHRRQLRHSDRTNSRSTRSCRLGPSSNLKTQQSFSARPMSIQCYKSTPLLIRQISSSVLPFSHPADRAHLVCSISSALSTRGGKAVVRTALIEACSESKAMRNFTINTVGTHRTACLRIVELQNPGSRSSKAWD